MEWILIPLVILLGVIAVAFVAGWLLPRRHLAAASVHLDARPQRVWELVSDFAGGAAWRREVKEVERLPDVNGRPVWRETSERGSMTFVVDEWQPPRRLTTRIADKNLGFGGTWEYLLEPEKEGTRLTILERGEVSAPVYRLLAHLFIGHHAAMNEYLDSVGRAFGEEVRPERRDPTELLERTSRENAR